MYPLVKLSGFCGFGHYSPNIADRFLMARTGKYDHSSKPMTTDIQKNRLNCTDQAQNFLTTITIQQRSDRGLSLHFVLVPQLTANYSRRGLLCVHAKTKEHAILPQGIWSIRVGGTCVGFVMVVIFMVILILGFPFPFFIFMVFITIVIFDRARRLGCLVRFPFRGRLRGDGRDGRRRLRLRRCGVSFGWAKGCLLCL